MLSGWQDWLNSAPPGSTCVYFHGSNLGDCASPETCKSAKQAFAAGLVELFQRRCEDGKLDYVAVKRKLVRKPSVWGSPWLVHIANTQAHAVYLR